MPTILEKARSVLEQPVCDNCLGRQFGQLLSGYTNAERGRCLRALAAMPLDKEKLDEEDNKLELSNFAGMAFHNLEAEKIIPKARKPCSLCHDVFQKAEKWAARAAHAVRGIEFRTFVVGTKLSADLLDAEEGLWERVGIDWAEPLKAELNREIGKRLEPLVKGGFEPKNPEIVILADLAKNCVSVQINPLFIYGEYQKLVRGIPQTKWPSGKYKTSVEQIIAKPFMAASAGKAHALHGAGREDIDARCFAWRPFVLEIVKSKKRIFDRAALTKLAKKIGKQVKVRSLRMSNIQEVRDIKAAGYQKTYHAIITCKQPIAKQELKKLAVLVGEIRQRTPQRVLHRRGDRMRKRHVISLKTKYRNTKTFELTVRGDAGLYIKELISGDSGRTQPSVSSVLIEDCVCKALDVVKIHKKLSS